MTRPPPKRALKGSIATRLTVAMSRALARQIEKAAKAHNPPLSAAEWIRRAAEEKLG